MGKERQKKSLFLSRALFGILVLFLLIALVVGIVFFNHYTRERLYQEANSQLTEITSQIVCKANSTVWIYNGIIWIICWNFVITHQLQRNRSL